LTKCSILQGLLWYNNDYFNANQRQDNNDLERACVGEASALFMLSDQTSKAPENDDKKTILRALSVKKYNPKLNTLVQIIKPENKVRLCLFLVLTSLAISTTIWRYFACVKLQ
jgi:hypothetical protein